MPTTNAGAAQRALIPTDTAGRVGKLLPLLGSDKDGEIVAAAGAIRRTRASAGLDLHDLAATVAVARPPVDAASMSAADCRTMARWCLDHADVADVSERERRFLEVMARARWAPTPRQAAWLRAIGDRLGLRP